MDDSSPSTRSTRPQGTALARALPAATLPLLLAACGGHAAPPSTIEPQPQANPTKETNMQDIEAIKRGIDELAKADLSDIASLNRLLSADLQEEASSNPYFVIRRSGSGTLAGVAARNIELRSKKEDPSQALISVELAEPSVEAATFVRKYWPNAEFAPARPRATGSSAYWTAEQGEAKVTVGQPPDGDVVSTVAIDRIH